MAIKKLIKYGAIVPSALSGNTTPESEYLLQDIEYDEKGNVLVDSKFNSNGELEERHSYTLNQHGSLVSHAVEMPLDEVLERFVYDRNESDQLIAVTKFYGNDEGERTVYVYDDNNLPKSITFFDADGEKEAEEVFTYNEQKVVVKKVIHHFLDESQSKKHSYNYNEKGLLVLYVVEGNGEKTITDYNYNAHGLEENCSQNNSNGKNLLTIISEYDENLRLVKRTSKGYYVRITSIVYDKQGRIWEEQLSDENNFVIARNAFEYNDDGHVAEEVVYETDLTRAGRDTHMIMRYEYELY